MCFCLFFAIEAKTPRIDSLEQILISEKLSNKERVNLLLKLAKESQFVDTVRVRPLTEEALSLAQSMNLKNAEAEAYKILGNSYFNSNNPYLAHINYKKAEKIFLNLKDEENIFNTYYNLMVLFFSIDDTENTEYYCNKILETPEKYSYPSHKLYAEYIHGLTNYKDKSNKEAIDYFLNVLEKAKGLNDCYLKILSAWSCGDIYLKQGLPKEAIKYLFYALNYHELCETGSGITVNSSIAEAYARMNKMDSADYYLNKTLKLSEEQGGTKMKYYLYSSIIDSLKGDYKSSLDNFKLYHALSDSLAKAGKTAEIARMKSWHEIDQKEHENTILSQEHQKQYKLILILIGALVIIFSLLALSVVFYKKTIEKNKELKKLHTIKDKLFSVVAHDLRSPMGSLSTILNPANRAMMDKETQANIFKDITGRVEDTYNLLDNLLRWAKNQMQGMTPSPIFFDIKEKSEAITNSLKEVANGKGISLVNNLKSFEVFADKEMFDVVLRNLITNALKYTSKDGIVTVDSELSDNMVVISVKDTGIGMSQEIIDKLFKLSETESKIGTQKETGTGLGLVLCADFVNANSGEIWCKSKEGEGTTFFFSIPLK